MRRTMGRSKLQTVITVLVTATITYFVIQTNCPVDRQHNTVMMPKEAKHAVYDEQQHEYVYDKDMPLIFIGGMPRSGTTLMRAMLDAHPDVRCGEETRLIPRLLSMRAQWMKSSKEHGRLVEAGLTDDVIDDALSAFILEIIAKHGEPARRLCNKDPFVLKSMVYLHRVFPNGKYLLMLRDGRATVHSIISRKVTITGFNIESYKDCLTKWNLAVENMYNQCMQLGPDVCLPVFYEKLVLHPEEWMRKILAFLDIPWDDNVLHHEDTVGKPGGISLSKKEKSTDQVVKPVNLEALTKWVGHIPKDVMDNIEKIAPMLAKLGYDPRANPPNYGTPDRRVLENEDKIRENPDRYAQNVRQVMERPDKLKAAPPLGEGERGRGGAKHLPPDEAVMEGYAGDDQGKPKANPQNPYGRRRPKNPKFARRAEAPYPN
ncbi:protein-tyrosine sulfotransferase 1-like [Acanthaster planci]|uniref:Protein-tyrosine sulfotransferase n=1 Tax=Acanthaster planci TaxID=133434 RepID=A0A8B7Z8J3_ACAPL|nr:protein-tyrosine sulfotransferase 1-like [Acanthaster planci]XP_022101130.1 protein-tyrosine sulfotransferase 1-like [Acanthaster planci]